MISSLKWGIAQMWAYKRIVFIFFLTNFMFGFLLMLPGRAALSGFAAQTLMGQKLAGRFSFDSDGSLCSAYSCMSKRPRRTSPTRTCGWLDETT